MLTCYKHFFHRTAGKAEILKKYRKLAAKWHPDRYKGKDKEAAEKKFMDIASAKEVLTDPGMHNIALFFLQTMIFNKIFESLYKNIEFLLERVICNFDNPEARGLIKNQG